MDKYVRDAEILSWFIEGAGTEIISSPGAPLTPATCFSRSETPVRRIDSGSFLCG